MRINKSQVIAAIRAAKAAFDQGADPVAALNTHVASFGIAREVTREEAANLRQAYTFRGEQGAVDTAIATLRSSGVTVVDDETIVAVPVAAPAGDIRSLIAERVTPPVEEAPATDLPFGVEDVLTRLVDKFREALLDGGKVGIEDALDTALVENEIGYTEALDGAVDRISSAIVTGGDVLAVLKEIYREFTAPVAEVVVEVYSAETLEVRVARLERIARDLGLL